MDIDEACLAAIQEEYPSLTNEVLTAAMEEAVSLAFRCSCMSTM